MKGPSSIRTRWPSSNVCKAHTRENAQRASDRFIETYGPKYPKAAQCLEKNRNSLLTFYNFLAEHWVYLRTMNPIESTFDTIRHRTDQTNGCVTRHTMLAMIYKLRLCAETRWRRIRGFNHLVNVIEGVPFKDGIEVKTTDSRNAARSIKLYSKFDNSSVGAGTLVKNRLWPGEALVSHVIEKFVLVEVVREPLHPLS